MNELEFRGIRVDNNEWVVGTGYYQGIMSETNNPFSLDNARIKTIIITGGDFFHVKPETVGQFTGLTDKNGVKIFGKDIYKDERHGYRIIEYNDRMACYLSLLVKDKELGNPLHFENRAKIVIIGNEFENPELLEAK